MKNIEVEAYFEKKIKKLRIANYNFLKLKYIFNLKKKIEAYNPKKKINFPLVNIIAVNNFGSTSQDLNLIY